MVKRRGRFYEEDESGLYWASQEAFPDVSNPLHVDQLARSLAFLERRCDRLQAFLERVALGEECDDNLCVDATLLLEKIERGEI